MRGLWLPGAPCLLMVGEAGWSRVPASYGQSARSGFIQNITLQRQTNNKAPDTEVPSFDAMPLTICDEIIIC